MPNKLVKKGLIIGIILLFIGIGIQPALSNELTIPTISDIEKECDCQSNGKAHLAEKLLNRLDKDEVLSKDIKLFEEFNSVLSDRPICNMLEDLYKDYLIKAVIYLDKALDPYELLILTVVYLSMSMVYAYLSSVILMIYKSIGCNESYYIDD